MARYKAVLFAPDGDWVMDYPSPTIQEVVDKLANQGSRWYFYPFPVVVRDRGVTRDTQRIMDACEPYEWAKGRTLRTFGRFLANNPDWSEAVLARRRAASKLLAVKRGNRYHDAAAR